MHPQQYPPIQPAPPMYVTTTHWMHGILTALTCGAWGLVWFMVHQNNKATNGKRQLQYQHQMYLFDEYRRSMGR